MGNNHHTPYAAGATSFTAALMNPPLAALDRAITYHKVALVGCDGTLSWSSGTLTWSGANARLQVRIRLTQTVFGETEIVNLGPYTDTGSRELTLDDLDRFVQGADLVVTLTKINTVNTVGGFQAGTATARLSIEHTLSPRP